MLREDILDSDGERESGTKPLANSGPFPHLMQLKSYVDMHLHLWGGYHTPC